MLRHGRSAERGQGMRKTGFALIELLVVVAIIGLLAAIAIPQYQIYKAHAADAKAKSDLHGMATALEAYYTSSNTYAGTDLTTLKSFGFRQSSGVDDVIATANQTAYSLTANPTGGTGTWTFNSTTSQITAGS
jgi:prepilin-type N-terminal cleavage/methylation domain-containing protein